MGGPQVDASQPLTGCGLKEDVFLSSFSVFSNSISWQDDRRDSRRGRRRGAWWRLGNPQSSTPHLLNTFVSCTVWKGRHIPAPLNLVCGRQGRYIDALPQQGFLWAGTKDSGRGQEGEIGGLECV